MKKFVLTCVVAGFTLTGCIGTAKQPEPSELLDRAEMATGVEQSRLSVVENSLNVEGSAMNSTVNYKVKDKKGNIYRCYFTKGMSMAGSYSSDAICTKLGGDGSSGKKSSGNCNELLRKAGKC
ncbi:MAG: hypothetical protein IKR42_07440 [Campylobacter sp.]|nr:hypothetical protein [Campylobacter sp.]